VSSAERSKARICADIGISVLLDDDVRHLVVAKNADLEVLHFRQGLDEDSVPSGAKRVRTWQEFVTFVHALSCRDTGS
jgi:hypothetical protein